MSISMRIRGEFLWLLIAISLLLPNMNATGYRLVRSIPQRHHRKRMAMPHNLYADFAAINNAAGREVRAQSGMDSTGGGFGGGSGGGTGGRYGVVSAGGYGVGSGGGYGDGSGGSAAGSSFNPQQSCGNGGKKECDTSQIFKPGDPKQKTSCIAVKAAEDAKAANEAQHAAGQLAAQHIKQELAEKAFQSAKAAEAALSGKQMVLQQLEQEMHEAHAVVEEESNLLQNTESNMNAAVEAARAATQHFDSITELQKTFKDSLANIQAVAMGAQEEMSSKVQLLEAAKNRLASLQSQFEAAREDYDKTKQAAYKAACAAVEAKQKAANTNSYRKRRRQRNRFPTMRLVAK